MLWFDIAGSFNHVHDMICRHVYSILGAILIVRWTFSSKANLISATYSFFLAESRFVLSWGFKVARSKINWLQNICSQIFSKIEGLYILLFWRLLACDGKIRFFSSVLKCCFILKQTKAKRVILFTSLAVWSCHITALENQLTYRLSNLFFCT